MRPCSVLFAVLLASLIAACGGGDRPVDRDHQTVIAFMNAWVSSESAALALLDQRHGCNAKYAMDTAGVLKSWDGSVTDDGTSHFDEADNGAQYRLNDYQVSGVVASSEDGACPCLTVPIEIEVSQDSDMVSGVSLPTADCVFISKD